MYDFSTYCNSRSTREMAAYRPPIAVPTVDELYTVLKNSSVEKKVLLTCMKVEPAKIREFKIVNCGSEDSALVDTLEYFLRNKCPEEGQEWNIIIAALEVNNDFKTAEIIRKQYLKRGMLRSQLSVLDFPTITFHSRMIQLSLYKSLFTLF